MKMKDVPPNTRPQAEAGRREEPQAQPWHAADEKTGGTGPEAKPGAAGGPIGTHSLTGGGASVGLPSSSPKAKEGERAAARDEPPGAEEPDPLLEPRAGGGDLLGRR